MNGDRRRFPPADAINDKAHERDVAETRSAPIAVCDDARLPPVRADGLPGLGNELDRLYASLETVTAEDHPRTARLLASSTRKLAQKVIEEAGEVALAAVKHNNRNIVRESADLLYHLAVLWRRADIGSEDVWAEMRRRADSLGIAEKLPKSVS